jgi:hypothetical protein
MKSMASWTNGNTPLSVDARRGRGRLPYYSRWGGNYNENREERESLLYKDRGAGVRYGGRSPDVKTSRGEAVLTFGPSDWERE